MAKATQRRQLGVMGILGKHDKKLSWQEDLLMEEQVSFV